MFASLEPKSHPDRQRRAKAKAAFHRLVEFRGLRKLNLQQYQNHVRSWYDGPAGNVLALASLISLHEPLVGRMIRTRRFDVTRFDSILDIGSGAGQILGHLIKRTPASTCVVACDFSHNMLRRARTRIKSRRPAYVAADMTRLPFADESFGCITCGWVIEHLLDPRPGLLEMGRVLKPGGSLFLLATEDTYSGALTSRTWKCRTYNRKELHDACLDAGLPWHEQLWFTPVHKFFKLGGILVEAVKKPSASETDDDAWRDAPHPVNGSNGSSPRPATP